MPTVAFEGSLKLSSRGQSTGFKVIQDDENQAANPARFQMPEFDLLFVQDGSYLIPVAQGLVFSGNPYWNYIIGPGRIWKENSDHGYARASFPFALVERNQNCVFNGVMAFLFNGKDISRVWYQITQETCLYLKFDLWGQTSATYIPETIPEAATLKSVNAAEVANRLPTKPISALASDYPNVNINLAHFGSGISREHLTAYGLVVNGVNYVSNCQTRYGVYPYCESMRLPSYSTAKSAFAAVALMRLGQKYGPGIYNLLIKNYVPEATSAAGDWSDVTFGNAIDMSTGNFEQNGFENDEDGPTMVSFLGKSETYTDKIRLAFHFPAQKAPGQVWVYHTSDTFILTRAMNNFLVQKEGSGADIFNFVRDEVYIPLNLSAGALTTLRTDNSPNGAPLGGYGLFWTQDDIAKIALFINDHYGSLNGNQLLEPTMLGAAMQRNPDDRGLNTTGFPTFKYNNGFWAREWIPAEARQYSCSFWTPFMSGFGGITVVLMPNRSIYYYFSDNNEFSWYDAVNESNKITPMCP
jgi:CubicO group peptidase (beta-lactamase class C family)